MDKRQLTVSREEDDFEKLTKDQFKKWSAWYDSWITHFFYFNRVYKKIIETVKVETNLSKQSFPVFLDVACGTGEILFCLARRFPEIEFVGVDFSDDMLRLARKKTSGLKNIQFLQANIRNLPFPDDTFDIVLCSDALHHFSSPDESLREIDRVTKQKGFLFLIDPAFDTLSQKVVVGFIGNIIETAKKYYSITDINQLVRDNTSFVIQSSFVYHFTNFFVCRKR